MESRPEVLLVSCYELGHQPLGIALAAAFFDREGIRNELLDLSVSPPDLAAIAAARFVAISVPMHTALAIGVRFAALVRAENPDARICFFGHYAALNAAFLRRSHADAVLAGECEAELVALARGILQRRAEESVAPVPGREPAVATTLTRLSFLAPTRDGLPPLDRYARLERDGAHFLAGAVETTRGCKYLCRHCPVPAVYHGRFFAIPRETVLLDVERLVSAGARHVTFADPDFLNAPEHARRVAKALHERHPDLTFDFTTRIEHIVRHPGLIADLAAAGGLFILSAVESLSDRVLEILDKGHTRADVIAALAITRSAGIALRPSLVAFTPWTTRRDYLDLLDFAADADLVDRMDMIHLGIRLLIPPGSLLLERPELAPYLGPLDEAAFTYRWVHPDPAMDRLCDRVNACLAGLSKDEIGDGRAVLARIADLASHRFQSDGILVGSGRKPHETTFLKRNSPRLTEHWFC